MITVMYTVDTWYRVGDCKLMLCVLSQHYLVATLIISYIQGL